MLSASKDLDMIIGRERNKLKNMNDCKHKKK